MQNEVSAGIVVFSKIKTQLKYLLLHYEEGHWDLPKGHIEGKETSEETAVRETKEETGLDIAIIPGFKKEIAYYFTSKDKKLIHKKVIFFIGESRTDKVLLSHEHVGFEWLNYDDTIKRLTFDSAKEIVNKVDDFLKKFKLP